MIEFILAFFFPIIGLILVIIGILTGVYSLAWAGGFMAVSYLIFIVITFGLN